MYYHSRQLLPWKHREHRSYHQQANSHIGARNGHAKHRLAEDEQQQSAGHAGEVAEKDAHTRQEKTRAAPPEGQLILATSWLQTKAAALSALERAAPQERCDPQLREPKASELTYEISGEVSRRLLKNEHPVDRHAAFFAPLSFRSFA